MRNVSKLECIYYMPLSKNEIYCTQHKEFKDYLSAYCVTCDKSVLVKEGQAYCTKFERFIYSDIDCVNCVYNPNI